MNDCVFCYNPLYESPGIGKNRFIKEYEHWWLVLQREDKLKSMKQAAGLLIAKDHVSNVTDVHPDASVELLSIIKETSNLLCAKVGTTYTDQETVGFNQGTEAGQSVMHAHVHILPVSAEDPPELKIRAGMGGAFEALREKRLSNIK